MNNSVRLQKNTDKQHKVNEEIAKATAHMVWNRLGSKNVRDCVRIGRIAKSVQDVDFISDTLKIWLPS